MLTEIHLHTGQPVAPHDVWTAWEIDLLVLGAVAVTALAYGRGLKRLSRRDGRGRFFGAGMIVLLVALGSPVEGMAGSLASAHMVQHMLLVMVSAPLLAWSRPLPTMFRGSPLAWRKATGNWRRRWRLTPSRMDWLTHPALAWLSLAASLWLWHSSFMYDLAVRSEAVHALEHTLFLVSAVWFWSAALKGVWSPRHSVGPAILLLFTMGVQGVLLSAMLTFSEYPWYEAYVGTAALWGLTPLEDQHLAGLIMWIPGGLLYTGSALALLVRWIGDTGSAVEAELESRPTDMGRLPFRDMSDMERAAEVLVGAEQILVFTGAGISTESGIPDFRGPDGLWTKVDPDDFTIQRYVGSAEIRERGWRMHAGGELWGARSTVTPNPGHLAIVDLHEAGRLAGCVTQNVDGLHLVSGLPQSRVAELHGNVRRVVCLDCESTWETEEVLQRVDAGEADPRCSQCAGILKTSTVMFGELLPEYEMAKAWAFAGLADAVLVVGSTVGVWPAADIPISMRREGKPMVIVNRGPTEADHLATVRLEGSAGEVLPPLVGSLLDAETA